MKLLNIEVVSRGAVFFPRYALFEERGFAIYHLTMKNRLPDYPFTALRHPPEQTLQAFLETAKAWHAEERFDAVITTDEASVIATGAITEALGLRGLDLRGAQRSRNKYYMRNAHAEGGAPHPEFRLCRTLEDAILSGEEIGYPVIVKPTLGGDAEHVYRVDDSEQMRIRFPLAKAGNDAHSHRLLEADGKEIGPHGLLVERFLAGPEHCVEAWVMNGEVHLGSIADRISLELDTFDNDLYKTPTSLSDEQVADLHQAIRHGVEAQGIRHGVVHAELRFDRGKPYLLEIAARPGGGSLFKMARISYGYCPITAAIDVAAGRRPEKSGLHPTGRIAVGLTMLSDGGLLTALEVPKEVSDHPSVFNFAILPKVGDVIRRPPHGNDIFGFIGTEGATLEEATGIADMLFRKLTVELDRSAF